MAIARTKSAAPVMNVFRADHPFLFLIRDGARLVENVDDVMQELASLAGELAGRLGEHLASESAGKGSELDMSAASRKLTPRSEGSFPQADERPWETDPDYRALWACLGFDPKPVESIIRQTGLTAPAVSAMLLMLELRGMVEAHAGGAYSRKKKRP